MPTGASAGRISRPSASSASASSFAEQSMPCESSPRSFDSLIVKPPGSFAPGSASGTLSPSLIILRAADDLARAGAVVHLANAQPVGIRMRRGGEDLRRRRRAGSRRRSTATPSTSVPESVSLSSISGTGTVRSIYWPSQRSENFIGERETYAAGRAASVQNREVGRGERVGPGAGTFPWRNPRGCE